MLLAALIIIDDQDEPAEAGAPLLFGQSVAEFQARLAHAAGATHIVMLAGRFPATLVAGLDRMRGDGVPVEAVRSVRDAVDQLHPDEQVMVFAAPMIPAVEQLATLARGASPMLWTQDSSEDDIARRIDAQMDWSGLALVPGQMLRDTAAQLGDWDFAPTLLRRLVQANAARHRIEGDWAKPVREAASASRHARTLLAQASSADGKTLSDRPLGWIARQITPQLLRWPLVVRNLDRAALPLAALALPLALTGWVATGLSLFLLATLLAALAAPLSKLPLGRFAALRFFRKATPWAGALLAIFTGAQAALASGQDACLVLGLWAASLLRPLPCAHPAYVDAPAMALLLLGTHVAGQPIIGLVLAVLHGLASRLHAERTEA